MDVEIYAWLSDLYFMIEIGDYNGAFQKMSSLRVRTHTLRCTRRMNEKKN